MSALTLGAVPALFGPRRFARFDDAELGPTGIGHAYKGHMYVGP